MSAERAVVFQRGGEARASSRDVATAFGKAHKNVLRAIDQMIELEPDLGRLNFEPREYLQDGAVPKPQRYFEMDRDGFSLLAMGFTGAEALKWKRAYIEAFNTMEARLRAPVPANDRVIDLEGALGTQDDRHAIKTALLMINTYKDLYGQQAGREMLQKLGFPVPQVHLAPAPTGPGEAPAPKEGDLHAWSVAAKLKPSRREATHLSELFQSYTAWCDRTGAVAMHAQKFRDAMVMLFNHEEHPEMIRVVLAA